MFSKPKQTTRFERIASVPMSTHAATTLGKRVSSSRGMETASSTAVRGSAVKKARVASTSVHFADPSQVSQAAPAPTNATRDSVVVLEEETRLAAEAGEDGEDDQRARDVVPPSAGRSSSAADGFSPDFFAADDREPSGSETAEVRAPVDTVLGSATSGTEGPTTIVNSSISSAQAPVSPRCHCG